MKKTYFCLILLITIAFLITPNTLAESNIGLERAKEVIQEKNPIKDEKELFERLKQY
ncbi:hypothetical protein AB3N04_00290 (plasmid) [Alkalihalophilus sp. As8PL]|uniref:Uncharacterized protein n=1 Tax=Alkalihalophilus sp. As8PL TaxID=3237103 RepID=A0AB39BN86_9BACI